MKFFSTFILLLFFGKVAAQNSNSLPKDQFYLESTVLALRSTHTNYFNGFSLLFGDHLNQKFNLALGYEYSGSKFHNDNDWRLYNLSFNVILIREQFTLFSKKKFNLSADFREGLSFIKYVKEEPLVRKNYRYRVKEKGLYLYGGIDAKYEVSKCIAIVSDLGIKGLHMSTNVYEVNPHGLSVMAGLQIKL